MNILTLSKHKADARIRFIDASGEGFFRKETNNNVLTDEHIAHIVELFASDEDVPHVARWVDLKDIEEQDYNLSVSSYIEAEDTARRSISPSSMPVSSTTSSAHRSLRLRY